MDIKKIKTLGALKKSGYRSRSIKEELRKNLIFKHNIFTGGSANKKLLRILPPLNITEHHIDMLYNALTIELE